MKIDNLIAEYGNCCNKIIKEFVKKQKIDFDGWAGDVPGTLALFAGQYSFCLEDIILDLKSKAKKWEIMEWQEAGVEHHFECKELGLEENWINYNSWLMGLRYTDLKDVK